MATTKYVVTTSEQLKLLQYIVADFPDNAVEEASISSFINDIISLKMSTGSAAAVTLGGYITSVEMTKEGCLKVTTEYPKENKLYTLIYNFGPAVKTVNTYTINENRELLKQSKSK